MKTNAARLAAGGVALFMATTLRAQINLGNIVCLGDSITEGKYGYNVPPGLPGGYRQYLQNDLSRFDDQTYNYTCQFVGQEDNGSANNSTGFSTGMADPNNEGYGSFTVNDLITGYTLEGHTAPPIGTLLSNDATAANMPAGDTNHNLPSVVLLMIGTNDALQGSSPSSTATALGNLVSAIVTDDPSVHLYVASILPCDPNSQLTNNFTTPQTLTAIQTYDAVIPSVIANYNTSGHPVNFVDNYSTIDPYTQTSDGVHPTYSGYQQVAQAWAHAIDEANRGIQTVVNTSSFTSAAGQPWLYSSIFVNGFDPSPSAGLNGATATFMSDTGGNFPNLFMSVEAGTVYLQSTQHLAALTIGYGGSVQVTPTTGSRSVLSAQQYFIDNGTLDLTNNALDVQAGSLTAITTLIENGFAGNSSNGAIISSTAAADTNHLTTLGVILNNNGGSALYGNAAPLGLFDGTNPSASDVLVKYTYYGDANLDGKVDGSDYSRIDASYLSEAGESTPFSTGISGWYNGDFNYDGVVNGSDYTLIDNAFNRQGAQLTASIAETTDQIAGSASTVPEPPGVTALAVASLSLLPRRRRNTRQSISTTA